MAENKNESTAGQVLCDDCGTDITMGAKVILDSKQTCLACAYRGQQIINNSTSQIFPIQLTKREQFAKGAMEAILSNPNRDYRPWDLVIEARQLADNLIKALEV